MTKTLYLIRHCKATGQHPAAPLTDQGLAQAQTLSTLLADAAIQRIVSSPYLRARQSAEPLAARLQLPIEEDERLIDRVLSQGDLSDWFEQLRASFDDFDLCLPGGESNRTAQQRGVAVLHDALAHPANVTAIVTHGNLMTLLLHHFDAQFGFAAWHSLTNPDVYRVIVRENDALVTRITAGPHP
jgi:2,3-bisphosphoglycerate-dependent phosphoglycerate mutase